MAIVLEANYCKKLGLPGYSSHQYSLTVRTELADLTQVASESAKLHTTLQDSVDREIQKTGFLPEPKAASPRGDGNAMAAVTPTEALMPGSAVPSSAS